MAMMNSSLQPRSFSHFPMMSSDLPMYSLHGGTEYTSAVSRKLPPLPTVHRPCCARLHAWGQVASSQDS